MCIRITLQFVDTVQVTAETITFDVYLFIFFSSK